MMPRFLRQMDKFPLSFGLVVVLVALLAPGALAGSIAGSKHDLSVGGEGPIAATSEQQVCVFCHVPHGALSEGPLWNHATPDTTYALYTSSTSQSLPRQPLDSTLLCLSCHDGTVAVGNLVSGVENVANTDPNGLMPLGRSNLGPSLADDHPVGVAVPTGRVGMMAPGQGDEVRLLDGRVECVTCHNPHDPGNRPFLAKGQLDALGSHGGQLCVTCHRMPGWEAGIHSESTGVQAPPALNPNGTTTVAQLACAGCHSTHNASVGPRLQAGTPENQCLVCHDGTAATNVANTQPTRSTHMFVSATLHDPVEEYRAMPQTQRHATCADCHNSHAAAKSLDELDGLLPGSLKEVRAVQAHYAGEWSEPTMFPVVSAAAEYEICFKCHSAFSYGTTPPVSPSRQAADGLSAPAQTSPARQFDPLNAAMHAVVKEHPRRLEAPPGTFVGLDRTGAPWSWDSVLLCTDCHGSDDVFSDVRGMHGSGQPFMLKAAWVHPDSSGGTLPGATGTMGTEDHLCFKCHDYRTYVMGGLTGAGGTAFRGSSGSNLHGLAGHAQGCTNCHAAVPHGYRNRGMLVEVTDPAPYNNGAKVKFPRDSVGDPVLPAPGAWEYTSCETSCHSRLGASQ